MDSGQRNATARMEMKINTMETQEQINKLLIKATAPGILRERQRQICWKALRMLDSDVTSVWWVLKMNVKQWIHEKIFGTKWCD